MNHPLFYTPAEAEKVLSRHGCGTPTADSLRAAAVMHPELIGFPCSVIGTRVYFPKKSFDEFWGITDKTDKNEKELPE